jgi:D-alanyl-D-alanine carboxypeptidase/D-alanyl-D-alanine-endopeptidase (penicillin-binding protein 4)
MEKLGPDFTFHTLLVMHDDNLIVIGDGDPTLGDSEMLKKVGWDVDTVFKAWAAGLAKRHITTVKNILVDDSVFDEEYFHPHWPKDQINKDYEPEVAGLNLNANCIDFAIQPVGRGKIVDITPDPLTAYVTYKNTCVGGDKNDIEISRSPGTNIVELSGTSPQANTVAIPIHDPPLYAGTVLSEILKANGMTLTGSIAHDRTARAAYAKAIADGDKSWVLLAVHDTPLMDVVARANKDSMNLYAECLCKRIGFAASGVGSWQSGTAVTAQFLASLNVPANQFTLDDGCGLSRQNSISPHAMVMVLTHDFFGKNVKAWFNTLAVAGEDGTLTSRFHGTDLRGRVFAKTGFVEGASCLSGYLHARDDNWYCFSIMFKGIPHLSNSAAKTLQDKIVHFVDENARAAVAGGQ